jgi:DNA polymerase-3 subunit gamma/tau
MQSLVGDLDAKIFLLGQQHLRSAEVQVKHTTQPRLWLEVTLLGLLPSTLASQAGGNGGAIAAVPAARTPPVGAAPPTPVSSPPPPATPPPSPLAPPPLTTPTPPPLAAPAPAAANHEPGPTQEPPPVEPLPPAAAGDLGGLWLQVIAVLEPLGTRALMQQQGSLLFFDGVVARVGISSKPLFKMAQGRIDNVEAAFQTVLGQKVQVSLEVLPDPKPEPPAANIFQASAQETGEQVEPRSVPAEAIQPPPAPVAPPAIAAPPPTTDQGTPPMPAIASEFDRAVKNFAQFFNGQVVDLGDDLVTDPNKSTIQPSDAAAKQPSHPDRDVPF